MKRCFGMEMNISRFFMKTLILACFVATSSLAVALEPPAKGELKRLAREGKLEESMRFARELGNYKTSPQVVARFQYKFQRLLLEKKGLSQAEIDKILAPPPAWVGMPTTGNVKVLTLLIDFSDTPHLAGDTVEAVTAKIFGDGSPGDVPNESLRNFYRRSSYNLLEIGGNVLGWYTTAYPRSSVVQTTTGREALIKEALTYYNGLGHDFSQYDNNGDGAIDYIAVVWAGTHGAWASFWWGYQTSFSDSTFLLDGKRLSKYSWQWESYSYPSGAFSPDVMIHETGHALGLPDLYDYDDSVGPRGGVGGLDQMDSNWGDHNAFSKWMMEWLTPTAVTSGAQTVNLAPTGSSPQAAIFMPDASSSQSFAEFFLVQNRYRSGNDAKQYPTDGLLIWHVDARLQGGDFLYDNSYTAHKLVRLMEADGLEEIEQHNASADAGDYYPQGGLFGPGTTPASTAYSGLPTGMGVRTITAPGTSQSCEIYRLEDSTPPTGSPTAPVDEGATIGRTQLIFTWTQGSAADPDSGIAGYNLRVGTSPGGNDLFQEGVGNVTTYTVTGAVNGATYYASVQAVNGVGTGGDWSSSSDGIQVVLPSLAEALDTTGLTWSTFGNLAWYGQTGTSHDGTDAGQSPSLGNSQSASFQATVVGPGTLTFYWKVSSEQDFDYLKFFLDGIEKFNISGEANWTLKSIAIPTGSHVVRWTYSKDEFVAGGQDLAWVDQVVAPGGGANPTISGTILLGGSPLAGVVMSGLTGDPVTNTSGVYSGEVTNGWSGTVTPTLTGYTFSPVNRVYANVTVNQTAQDFAATLDETVSTPNTPTGPTTGTISTSYDYSTGGSTSNLGHTVHYRLDWDDGSDSGWLAEGTTTASHNWAAAGTYDVKAIARCATHTTIESSWSETHSITITDVGSRVDFIGTWDGQGVYYRNSLTGLFVKLATPATLVTAGDLDGDGIDDLVGIWPGQGGVWVKYSATGIWAKLSSTARDIAAGDMNGDGRDDLLATWDGQGVYYRHSISGAWVQMATPAEQVTAGDLDGDNKDDLVGIWPSQGGVWVKYSQSGSWAKLSSTAIDIACGDMNGDGRDDLVATWDGQGVYYRNSIGGAWVKLATPATLVAAGDLDGDAKADVIGIWPGQGGVWVKYSLSGSWAKLSTTARHIAAGLMRGGASGSTTLMAEPFGGGDGEGPGSLGYQDMAAAGPGDQLFQCREEKNLTPQQDGESELQRVPGPGEYGFQCQEQQNLVPGSVATKEAMDKKQLK